MDCLHFAWIILGYTVSALVGDCIVTRAVESLWRASGINKEEYDKLRPLPPIRFWHGIMERALYTSTIVFGRPEGIAVWLAFKAVMRWKIHEDKGARIPGSNIYMIGTALNVAFGVLGGFIANWNVSLLEVSELLHSRTKSGHTHSQCCVFSCVDTFAQN